MGGVTADSRGRSKAFVVVLPVLLLALGLVVAYKVNAVPDDVVVTVVTPSAGAGGREVTLPAGSTVNDALTAAMVEPVDGRLGAARQCPARAATSGCSTRTWTRPGSPSTGGQ